MAVKSKKPSRRRASTQAEREVCEKLHEEFTHLIPGQYSDKVRAVLAAKGIKKTRVQVVHARNLDTFDLEVMLVLREMAMEEKAKLEAKLKGYGL